MSKKIRLYCLYCGQGKDFDQNSLIGNGTLNFFCSGECEDRYAFSDRPSKDYKQREPKEEVIEWFDKKGNTKKIETPSDTFIESKVEEFDKLAYPIVHSNTFPEKDKEYLERLKDFLKSSLLQQEQRVREEVEKEWREKIEKRADLQEKEWQKTKKIEHLTARMELESLIIDY